VVIALAVRAALRVLPIVSSARGPATNRNLAAQIALPVFRALSVAWASANWPTFPLEDHASASVEMIDANNSIGRWFGSAVPNRSPGNSFAANAPPLGGLTQERISAVDFVRKAAAYAVRCVYAAQSDLSALCLSAIDAARAAMNLSVAIAAADQLVGLIRPGAMEPGVTDLGIFEREAVNSDLAFLETGDTVALSASPLWLGTPPAWITISWARAGRSGPNGTRRGLTGGLNSNCSKLRAR
jgi:hypothetical protein